MGNEIKWSLQELRKKVGDSLPIEATLDVEAELKDREEQILSVSNVTVNGLISVTNEEFVLHYKMEYTLSLPSSRSLAPVEVPFSVDVDEVFMAKEMFENSSIDDLEEEILLIEGNTISLDESVKDNILLQIPIRVLTKEEEESEELPSGTEWEVISEEEYAKRQQQNEKQEDNPFSSLSNFFDEE